MAVIDSPVGDSRAIPLFDAIKKRFPNKRIRYVINTHHHFDHAGGLRDAVAEGATILTDRDNKAHYERVLANSTRSIRIDCRELQRLENRLWRPFSTSGCS